ncbi:MAG: S8 family peptidase, partial [Gemmatimonadota bacterium]
MSGGPAASKITAPQTSVAPIVIPDEYIVVFKNEVRNVRAVAEQLASVHGGRILHVYTAALKGFAVNMPAAAAERLSRSAAVDYVQPNGVVWATGEQTNATWGLDRIDQLDLPLNTTFIYDMTGAGVHAYIIDTGIRPTHADFGGRASIGADFIGDGQNGNDCNGHGTHVAGTVGGTTWGVAKDVSIVAVRVLNCAGSGSFAQVIAGIDWVTANHIKPAVANMSLGGSEDPATDQAVRNSIAAGVTYSLAAGNGNIFGTPIDACTQSPAGTVEALTIGATDIADAEASFSN